MSNPFRVSAGEFSLKTLFVSYEGCSRIEFDSSYPRPLNGIISETEFRASMKNINRAKLIKKPLEVLRRDTGIVLYCWNETTECFPAMNLKSRYFSALSTSSYLVLFRSVSE